MKHAAAMYNAIAEDMTKGAPYSSFEVGHDFCHADLGQYSLIAWNTAR